MATKTGLARVHRVMLALTGLLALVGIWVSLTSSGSGAWIYAAVGLIPIIAYGIIAWIVAGFLQTDPPSKVTDAPSEEPRIQKLATSWPRFWARYIDMSAEVSALALALGAIAPSVFAADIFREPAGAQLVSILLLPLAMTVDAAICAAFGTTIGKAIAGVRVGDLRGNRLPFLVLLRRNFGVWWRGLGGGVPIVVLFTLYKSRSRLDQNEILPWDASTDARVFDSGESSARTAIAAAVFLCLFVGQTWYSVYRNDPSRLVEATVKAINATAPQTIDSDTRLERAEVGPFGELVYQYTLTNVSNATHDLGVVNNEIEHGDFSRTITSRACGLDALRPLIDAGVRVVFLYSDSEGNRVGRLRIDSSTCIRQPNR